MTRSCTFTGPDKPADFQLLTAVLRPSPREEADVPTVPDHTTQFGLYLPYDAPTPPGSRIRLMWYSSAPFPSPLPPKDHNKDSRVFFVLCFSIPRSYFGYPAITEE